MRGGGWHTDTPTNGLTCCPRVARSGRSVRAAARGRRSTCGRRGSSAATPASSARTRTWNKLVSLMFLCFNIIHRTGNVRDQSFSIVEICNAFLAICFELFELLGFLSVDRPRYPVLRGAAHFFLSHMRPADESGSGTLLSGPAHSPENSYKSGDGSPFVSMAPAMDVAVIVEVGVDY